LLKELRNRILKEKKNNFSVFSNMTKEEWEEVVEPQLLDFFEFIKLSLISNTFNYLADILCISKTCKFNLR
jgi:hypothetical protein